MESNSVWLNSSPIQFGTDGWRGVLGVDITLEKLLKVSAAAARELSHAAPAHLKSREIILGFDRRFMAPEFAAAIVAAIKGCQLDPILSSAPVTTPACSWAVVHRQALGALVITASHNPPQWIGLKIKGPNGASVNTDFTEAVEKRLSAGGISVPQHITAPKLDIRNEHLNYLRKAFDINQIADGLKRMNIKVLVDSMYGSASGCIKELFSDYSDSFIKEIHTKRDPLFGGHPPEPIEPYVDVLKQEIQDLSKDSIKSIGLIFDGDGDRIASIDENGRFCSTQDLIPILIQHLSIYTNLPGSVVKTVSGSDVMSLVAEDCGRNVIELPVGFKYIAAEMLSKEVLIGGEESGGIGFGHHLPERDALFSALLLLESIASSGRMLGEKVEDIKNIYGNSYYERIDLELKHMHSKDKLKFLLTNSPPKSIAGISVKSITSLDGFKFRLGKFHWLMLRFSGTEPLLRIYCEAPNKDDLKSTLEWALDLAKEI